MNSDELDRMAIKVKELCKEKSLMDICIDLNKTKNVEATLNRIFEGTFLKGTERDPSHNIVPIILDSDDDDDMEDPPPHPSVPPPPPPVPKSKILQRKTTPPPPAPSKLQRQISLDSSPEQPKRTTPTTISASKNHTNMDDDDDNDSLPSLDALITQITERHVDPIELDDDDDDDLPPQPQRKYTPLDILDQRDEEEMNGKAVSLASSSKKRKLTPLDILDQKDEEEMYGSVTRKRTSLSPPASMDFLKEWASDIEDELRSKSDRKGKGRLQPKKKASSTQRATAAAATKKKNWKSPSTEINYLKDWDSSSDDDINNDNNAEEENDNGLSGRNETAKEKRERLKKQKELDREQKAQKRKESQDAKKADRDRAKEEKKAEKERKKLLEHANRLRVNRNELLSEMILDVRPEFACSPRGQLLKQVVTEKEAEFHASDTGLHTITWRRRCMAQWDEEKGVFLPYPDQKPRIIKESYVLLFMDMPQLCALISSQDMNSQIDRIQSRAGEDAKIILMTEGLETYYKKKNVLVQRDFNKVVLENLSQQQEQTSNGSSTPSKKRTTTGSSKSNDPIVEAARTGPRKVEMEEKLTYLQMMKNIRLVPTVDLADTVDWIVALTADIANAMYKHRNFKYFKHQGPAKSGVDAADSWSKMLQEIQLCTPAVADAVISKYPNLSSLHRAYQCVGLDDRDKEKLLAELEVERSVISSRDRTVNKHMSKKIYTIFSSTDDQLNIA